MSSRNEIRKLIRELRHLGFTAERTRGDHYRIVAPDGAIQIIGSTPRRTSVSALLRLLERHRHRHPHRKELHHAKVA